MHGGIFISHASVNAEVAARVVTVLEADGIGCWIAPRDIDPGSPYTRAILDGLAEAPGLVLLLSAAANASAHVEREVERVVGTGKRILPLRLERIPPSDSLAYLIGSSQWLEVEGVADDVWQPALVRAVRALLADHDPAAAPPSMLPPTPAPAPAPAPRSTLPAPRGQTWGRDALRADVAGLLTGGDRLVTLTGLGGIGKSRLAVEVARALDSADVTVTLADGLDQTPDGAESVQRLLDDHPATPVLATSRLPLGLAGERVVTVPPLGPADAVQLLVATASRSGATLRLDGNEDDVADLCRLVDGVPLALELAAARLKVLGLDRVRAALQGSLDLLGGWAGTVAWTLDRVDPADLEALARLCGFAGPFGLNGAEAVCPDPLVFERLDRLMAAGLLRVADADPDDDADQRYLVPAPVRLVMHGRAPADQARTLRETVAAFLLGEVEGWADRLDTADGQATLTAYRAAAADVDAAVGAALDDSRIETAYALAVGAAWLDLAAGRLTIARARCRRVLAAVDPASDEAARLLAVIGRFSYHLNEWPEASDELQRSLDLAQRHDDRAALATARTYLGATQLMTGDVEAGAALAAGAYADSEELGLYPLAAEALSVLAISYAIRGQWDDERATHERRLEVARRHRDLARTADALNTLAEIALDEDDAESAHGYAKESLALAADRLPLESRDALITLARASAAAGRAPEAAGHLRQALAANDRTGQHLAVAQCLRAGGVLAVRADQPALAVRLFAAAQTIVPSPNGTDDPVEHDLAAALGSAREALGANRAGREWTLGTALPLDTMVGQLEEVLTVVETPAS